MWVEKRGVGGECIAEILREHVALLGSDTMLLLPSST
jgi:hypothetical protein